MHSAGVAGDSIGDGQHVGGQRGRAVAGPVRRPCGLWYCPRKSTATTRRPAAASGSRTGRKFSLLPV